jgi:hypothetical protein
MLHYLLQPHRQIIPMFIVRPTKPPYSLSRFSTSTNRSMRFRRNPMLSKINAMINTRYCTSFRWETRSSYIFRNNTLKVPIRSFIHFVMGLAPSLRLWVTMLLSSTLPLPWITPNVQCGPPSTIFSTIIEQLKPIDLKPNCMEHASTDQIVYT